MIEKTKDGYKINGVELIYSAGSLIPFFKLKSKNKKIQKENFEDFVGLFEYMKKHLKGYFKMSILYNAYQEKEDGILLSKNNKLNHDVILADSGGLQQARRGEKFSDEVKKAIYENQALYSDIAMNFDEMPFLPIEANKKAGINLMSTRCYIREMIEPTAKLSAEEVRKQLEVFSQTEGAHSKVLPVMHGFRSNPEYFKGMNDNTFVDYAETLFNNIDIDSKFLGGLSIASITVSADNRIALLKGLQYIPSLLWSKRVPDKAVEHVHLLGLASPQRLMSVLSMLKAGLIDKRVKRISFDSTAITKAFIVGRVHKNRDEFKNPRHYRPELTLKDYKSPEAKNVRQFYQNVYEYFKNYDNFMFSSWEDLADYSLNNGSKKTATEQIKENGGEGSLWHRKYLQHIRVCSLYLTWCYLEQMEDYIDGIRKPEDYPYGANLVSIYHTIENDITDEQTLFEAVEMHYKKVKENMDFAVDTIQQYKDILSKIEHEDKFGVQETNILFEDVEKLHESHEDHKKFAQQKIDNHNFMRRSKKKASDEFKIAGEITKSIF